MTEIYQKNDIESWVCVGVQIIELHPEDQLTWYQKGDFNLFSTSV